jgi:hypothetical protein
MIDGEEFTSAEEEWSLTRAVHANIVMSRTGSSVRESGAEPSRREGIEGRRIGRVADGGVRSDRHDDGALENATKRLLRAGRLRICC